MGADDFDEVFISSPDLGVILPCPEAWEENKYYDVLINNNAWNPDSGFCDKFGREGLHNKDDRLGNI